MKRLVLAVDIGTSSLKAALIDERGTVHADARCRFPRAPRTVRHWIDAFVEASCVLSASLKGSTAIVAVAVSGNGPTLVGISESGDESRVLLWNDPVPPPDSGESADSGELDAIPGASSIFIPRIKAFRALFPEFWREARHLVSGPEYLIYCLSGEMVTILPERRYENAYWTADALRAQGIAEAEPLLPQFAQTGAIVGKTGAAALDRAFGAAFPAELREIVPSGIPVVAGGPDFVAALIGTGTLEPGAACDRAGTSEGLNVCTTRPIAHGDIRTLPSVIDCLWNASYLLPETGAQFHAWRKQSGQAMRSYPEIMREIEASPIIPAGDGGANDGRALVERIGFSVRAGIDTLRAATGLNPSFTLSGGQARNAVWNQMKSDITGATFALTTTPDGELMGDAIVAFAALGDYASLKEGASEMVSVVRVYEPDPARHAQYSENYRAWKPAREEPNRA